MINLKELNKSFKLYGNLLTYRERKVINLRFSGDDGFYYTRTEIAKIFKISASRVQQIEKKGIRELQNFARANK